MAPSAILLFMAHALFAPPLPDELSPMRILKSLSLGPQQSPEMKWFLFSIIKKLPAKLTIVIIVHYNELFAFSSKSFLTPATAELAIAGLF